MVVWVIAFLWSIVENFLSNVQNATNVLRRIISTQPSYSLRSIESTLHIKSIGYEVAQQTNNDTYFGLV